MYVITFWTCSCLPLRKFLGSLITARQLRFLNYLLKSKLQFILSVRRERTCNVSSGGVTWLFLHQTVNKGSSFQWQSLNKEKLIWRISLQFGRGVVVQVTLIFGDSLAFKSDLKKVWINRKCFVTVISTLTDPHTQRDFNFY